MFPTNGDCDYWIKFTLETGGHVSILLSQMCSVEEKISSGDLSEIDLLNGKSHVVVHKHDDIMKKILGKPDN